jgi:hypothetical protein
MNEEEKILLKLEGDPDGVLSASRQSQRLTAFSAFSVFSKLLFSA